jgi:cytochrome c biogenesis protein CcmG, thiol:disulfide interchange protein DsbE
MSAKNIPRRLANWAVVAFVAAVLYVFITPWYRQGEPYIVGKKAEDFPLTVAGKQTRLSEFRGKVVVLNFWASWCGSCVEEMPDLDRLQARIRSRGGIVLGVSVDENCGNYEDFLKKYPLRFSTACEPTNKVSLDYLYSGPLDDGQIPETYIIDREGRIVRRVIGPQQWDSAAMNAYFDSILAAS